MNIDNGLDAQGTELRVLDTGAAVSATAARTGSNVTVSKVAHGLKAGDRIDVDTGNAAFIGRRTVASATADAYVFTTSTSGDITSAAITYRKLHSIAPKSISGFGGTRNVVDATNLSHSSKRKRGGLRDNGQLQTTFNYDPAFDGHVLLQQALDDNRYLQVELAFTDSPTTYWSCQAFVSAFTLNVAMDNLVEASCTLEIDGDIDVYN